MWLLPGWDRRHGLHLQREAGTFPACQPLPCRQRGKKKCLQYTTGASFICRRRKHGLFPAVSRGHQSSAHGGCLQMPEILFTDAASSPSPTGCFPPCPNRPQIQHLHQPWGASTGRDLYPSGSRHHTDTQELFLLKCFLK